MIYALAVAIAITSFALILLTNWAFARFGNIAATRLLIFSGVFTFLAWAVFISSIADTSSRWLLITVGLALKEIGLVLGCIGFYFWGKGFREFR